MKDSDWLRKIAATPLHNRQPLYEATRLYAVAAKLEMLQSQNAKLKETISNIAEFMRAQEKGDLEIMGRAAEAMQGLMTAILQSEEPDAIVTEINANFTPGGQLTVTGGKTLAVQYPQPLQPPQPEPPNTIDADPTALQEE